MMKKLTVTLLLGVFMFTSSMYAEGECCASKTAVSTTVQKAYSLPTESGCCASKVMVSTTAVQKAKMDCPHADQCTPEMKASCPVKETCPVKKQVAKKQRARVFVKGATLLALR